MKEDYRMNKKSTKRSLLFSVLALILCCSLLAGTTLAWFTDTASSGVNKIQAGNLDIALEMKNNEGQWVDAEGETLQFKVNGQIPPEGTQILWEPGCTYELPELKITNNGNLKLKYKIVISGIGGDVGLNEVIDWKMTVKDSNGSEITKELTADHPLDASANNMLIISGHMREDAGNEYQGMSIDNIAITVAATQLGGDLDGVIGEFDSIDNEYDKNAVYPPLATYLNETATQPKSGTDDMVIETPVAKSTVPAEAQIKSAAKTDDSSIIIQNKPMATDSSLGRVLKTTASTADSVTYDISYIYTETTNGTPISYNVSEFSKIVANVIELSTGLKNVKVTHSHNGEETPMQEATNENASQDGYFFYNPVTGKLTIWSSKYSSFAITFQSDFVAAVNGQGYATLGEAIDAAGSGETITLLRDVTVAEEITFNGKSATLNLNGHKVASTVAGNGTNAIHLVNGAAVTIENGTIEMAQPYRGIYVNNSNEADTAPKLTMRSVTVTSNDAVIMASGPHIEVAIDQCNLSSTAYTAVYVNGSYSPVKVSITNSTITSEGEDVEDPAVYISNASFGNREKQTLIVDNCQITGVTAIEVKHTIATITNSTLISTTDPSRYNENNNGSTSMGYCFATTSNSNGGQIDATTGTVTFSGCTFKPAVAGCDVFNSYATAAGNAGAVIEGYENSHVLYPGQLVPLCLNTTTGKPYYTLPDAATEVKSKQTIVMQGDVTLGEELYLSGKNFTLDLNGHSIALEYREDAKPNNYSTIYIAAKNSNLTIKDSSTAQTGSVYGPDINVENKAPCAVRIGNYGKLNIYGGHYYGRGQGNPCIFTHTSMALSTAATVKIYGGTFETAGPSSDGKYFVLNHQDSMTTGCKMTVYGGTFINYNPGVTSVDPTNAKTGKIELGTGCTTTEESFEGGTRYIVTKQ